METKEKKKNLDESKKFFHNNLFFDNKVKQKIEKKSEICFTCLVNWCCIQCCNKPNPLESIGNKEYVTFFLYSIYRHKEIIEKLYKKTFETLDKGFKLRIIDNDEQFKHYLWELYLRYYFITIGEKLKKSTKNNGPDICIVGGEKKQYIECIAPNMGDNAYSVPKMNIGGIGNVPIAKIKKRFQFALKEKADKYKKYIKEGIVDKNDKIFIALNTSCLSEYGNMMDSNKPLLLECCEEINFFENYDFIDGIIYNHKSIFEYNNNFKIIIINNDYSYSEQKINIAIS